MSEQVYIGLELDLFAKAVNWKAYYGNLLKRHLRGDVLEVGAGIGATTKLLCDGTQKSWTCLEPDPELAKQVDTLIRDKKLPSCCNIKIGTINDLKDGEPFDAIIYIDVLEHIEDDKEEARRASKRLKPGGSLVILSPAHQWLYTPFDKAIGHYRRYSKRTMRGCMPDGLKQDSLRYLDSADARFPRQSLAPKASMPTEKQIKIWDRLLVPVSKVLDPVIGYSIGKSVMAVWRNG